MGRILIKHGKVWDGENFFFADVLTENERIIKIDADINEPADYTYDASGKIVSPGLVDIHTHMLGSFGINAEMSCIPFGVTAAVDVSAKLGNREKYDNFLVKNKVFVTVPFESENVSYEQLKEKLEHYKGKVLGIKVFIDAETFKIHGISPLKEIADFARKNKLKVMVHTSNSPVKMSEIVSSLNEGDIITHAYHGGENNFSENDYEPFKQAREKGIFIDVGFAGYVHTDFGIFSDAMKKGYKPDTISTDITKLSAYKRGGKYGMTMCMSMAKVMGMSDDEILCAITSKPAKVIGEESVLGYLKEGRCADISVFDFTGESFSLTDKRGNTIGAECGYECTLCVCNGEVVFRK